MVGANGPRRPPTPSRRPEWAARTAGQVYCSAPVSSLNTGAPPGPSREPREAVPATPTPSGTQSSAGQVRYGKRCPGLPGRSSGTAPTGGDGEWGRLCTWCSYGLVVVLAAGTYLNTLGSDLVHDDVFAITTNKDVHANVSSVWNVFTNDFWGRDMRDEASHKSYRPLCVLTFRLNFMMAGLKPWWYHLSNVVLHAVTSALFLTFCHRHVFRFRRKWGVLGAAMFAVHPIHTEAVAGVVGRADILACMLFLISLMSYLSSVDTRRHLSQVVCTRRLSLFVICLITGSAAMFAKETGITVFGVCLLYEITVVYRVGLGRCTRTTFNYWRGTVMRTGAIILTVVLLLAVRWNLMGGQLPPFTNQDNPAAANPRLITRALTYWYIYANNVYLLAYPSVLSYDWQMGSIPLVSSSGDKRNLLSLALIVFLGLFSHLAFIKVKDPGRSRLVLGTGILVVPFLPATNLFFRVGFVLAERILYIPSMGYIILVVEGIHRLTCCATARSSGSAWRGPVGLVFSAVLLCGLWAGRTVVRNQVWRSRYHLFRSGLETLPKNAKMHYNFGNLLSDTRQFEEAINHYREAIRLWPTYASAHNNLATLLKEPLEAQRHYAEAIRISPRHAGALFNLGNLLIKAGKLEDAVAALERSIVIDDANADSHTSLASALAEMGRHVAAEKHYARAVELKSESPDYHNNYCVYLNQRGRLQEALLFCERAIQLDTHHHVAMVNAARVLRQQGRMKAAEQYLNRALAIHRDSAMLDYVGIFFFNQGQNDQALALFKEALERNPNSTEGRIHYAQALNLAGDHESAKRHLTTVLTSTPKHPEALHQMANVHGMKAERQKAVEYLNLAIEATNDTNDLATLYFELGNQLKDLSLYTQALQNYIEAIQRRPSIAEAHLNLGVIYHMKAQYKEALHHYTLARELLPNNRLLEDNMRKLQRSFRHKGG